MQDHDTAASAAAKTGLPATHSIKEFPAAGRADASTTAHGWAAIPRPSAETIYAGLGIILVIALVVGWWWTGRQTREALQSISKSGH